MSNLTPEHLTAVLALWSKTVEVQEHFNDISLRVRNLALTVMTGVLAGVGFAIKEKVEVRVLSHQWALSTWVSILGALIWLAFYGMDRFWYHRLLIGASAYAKRLEEILSTDLNVPGGLTSSISDASPVSLCGLKLHSTRKIDIFYGVGLLILLLAAWLGSGHLTEP